VTALDVDGQVLRVAVIAQRAPQLPIVTRLASAPLDIPADADRSDPNVLGHAIARALHQLDLKPHAVLMGISRAQVVLRTLVVPLIEDARELASVVHFQLGRDLPFRLEDAVIDFKVRRRITPVPPRPETGQVGTAIEAGESAAPPPKLEVLVAAVKRDVVEFHRETAEAAGLKLAALGLLSYANARCLEACRVVEGDQAVALVSLRPDEMTIDVIAQQSLLFSRGASVKPIAEPASAPPILPATVETVSPPAVDQQDPANVPAPEPPKPEGLVDVVTIEVVRSLHSYSGMEPDNPVAKIAVTGATGHEADVVSAISNRFSIPCSLLDLATALELPPESRDQVPGAIAPIGLALGVGDPQGLPFDFLNPKRPAVQRDLRRIRILAGIAAAAALFVFLVAMRTFLINRHERVRRELAAAVAEAEKKSPIYKQMIRQAASIDEWSKGTRNWLEQYAWLTAVLPASEDVYLTSLSVSGSGVIRMSVQARSGETLAKLEKQLRAAGYDVKPIAITPGADRYGYAFRSSIELVIPEKMAIDLSKAKTPARPADDASLDPPLRKGGRG
jgi:Tfp pilus assembly PilM family ATPase